MKNLFLIGIGLFLISACEINDQKLLSTGINHSTSNREVSFENLWGGTLKRIETDEVICYIRKDSMQCKFK